VDVKSRALPGIYRAQSGVYRSRQGSAQSIASGDRRIGRYQMIRKQHRVSVVALILVVAALFAAPASAEPVDQVAPVSPPASSTSPTPTPFGTEQAATGGPAEVQVVRVPSEAASGFDWGDAGIGAGAALAVTMIGLGGALALSTRRHREPSGQAVA
jgi:hypothetical protein